MGLKKREMFLHPCICSLVYMTISVSVSLCIRFSVCPCINMSVYQCIRTSVYPYISVSVYQCFRVSVHPCINVSVYQCVRVSVCSTCICSLVYQCVRVSMCTCICSLVYQCDRVSVHNCVSVCPCILLIDLATLLFLNQQVSTPTRKSNVLNLIFCSDELIKSVDVSECSFSDHCLIKTETYIPVDPITIQAKCINPSLNSFEKFDFNR